MLCMHDSFASPPGANECGSGGQRARPVMTLDQGLLVRLMTVRLMMNWWRRVAVGAERGRRPRPGSQFETQAETEPQFGAGSQCGTGGTREEQMPRRGELGRGKGKVKTRKEGKAKRKEPRAGLEPDLVDLLLAARHCRG
jgi:hypothetical protein